MTKAEGATGQDLHPQSRRRGLKQRDITLMPPIPGERPGCFKGRHPESVTDCVWIGDAALLSSLDQSLFAGG